MLHMSLKAGEYVKIGDDIVVYNNEDHQIDISILAPKEVKIERLPRTV
jgi:sRNA-binding carbon storage regulator CsrA